MKSKFNKPDTVYPHGSNCSNHKKDLFGQTDMKKVAEAIENMHYEAQKELYAWLSDRYFIRMGCDLNEGKKKLAKKSDLMGNSSKIMSIAADEAWQISKPFMGNSIDKNETL